MVKRAPKYQPEIQQQEASSTASLIDVLLTRPVAVHRAFITIAGDVSSGVMLAQAWYWSNLESVNFNWFWKTQQQWFEETGLSRREQETARRNLTRRKLLEEKLTGQPARMHFRLSRIRMEESLVSISKSSDWRKAPNLSAEGLENGVSDWRKAPNQFGGNVQTSLHESAKLYKEAESTSESTSYIPSAEDRGRGDFSLTPPEEKGSSLQARLTKYIHDWYKRENLITCPWGPTEAGMLANAIKRFGKNPEEILFKCVDNRFKGDYRPSDEPVDWIPRLLRYKQGPLNEFGNLQKDQGGDIHEMKSAQDSLREQGIDPTFRRERPGGKK